MNRTTATIILIIIVTVIGLLVYYNQKKTVENFVALSGLQPLTTYDSYGWFNGIYHFDDLKYYDPTFENLFYQLKETVPPGSAKDPGSIVMPRENIEDFSKDSFFELDNRITRRSLVPSNYIDHPEFADASFDQHQHNYILINTARERRSSVPPWPANVYFAK